MNEKSFKLTTCPNKMKIIYFKKIIFLFLTFLFLMNEIYAQSPDGKFIVSDGFKSILPYGFESSNSFFEEVSVDGQPFAKALRINTINQKSQSSDYGVIIPVTSPITKGDVLWLSFKARCIKSLRESGEALVEVRLDQLVNGKYQWPSYLERGFSVGSDWVEVKIPFQITTLLFHSAENTNTISPKDMQLVLRIDKYPQIIEISPIKLINCGQNVAINDLPRTVVKYDGDAPDASWRKLANERIEKFRKGDLIIKVIGKNGSNIPNASVKVRMIRNEFNWGTATNSSLLLGDNQSDRIYRDTLKRYFNQVVIENELKWKYWSKSGGNFDKTLKSVEWLNKNNIAARGHVMVWPSWKHSPKGLDSLKNENVALRKAIISEIQTVAKPFIGKLSEWDVINEPTMHHEIIDILGKNEMVKWFKEARKALPETKLFLNDFTMFHQQENNRESLNGDYFYNTAKYLIDNGAPLDVIGEQAHIGGTPPGIPFILSRLDKFATLKRPIQISEFDIYSNDDEFKARYMRDFMTALFSHPSAVGFVQWGFWEGSHWLPIGALWNKDWTIRENGKVYTELVSKTWCTHFEGKTSTNGVCKLRGFTGDYEIIVSNNGKITMQKCTLTNNGEKIVVIL